MCIQYTINPLRGQSHLDHGSRMRTRAAAKMLVTWAITGGVAGSMSSGPRPLGALDAQTAESTLAIVGGFLIDGNEGPPLRDAVILIEGDRITHVGTTEALSVPPNAEVIDANGLTVMPGLHDTHVHLMIIGHGVYGEFFPRYRDRLREIMPISARQLLDAGVTSARDLGGPLEESIWIKREIEEGRLPGPRLFVSGPFLQKTTGPSQAFFRWTIEGADDARAKVRQLVAAGVDVIKVIQADQLSEEERRAVREEADRAGLHIAAHGYNARELRAAVELGARTIEHVNARPLPWYREESVRLMADNGVASGFTSIVSRIYNVTQAYPERLDDHRLKADLPDAIYEDVRSSIEHPERLGYFDQKKAINPWHAQKFRQLYEGGVEILVGTDSGTPMNFHYESTWQEMDLLVRYGMPPMKAISAATRLPARLYGLGDELGTIEPGRLADIILVDGNPLRDMSALRNVVHVIKGGVQYR